MDEIQQRFDIEWKSKFPHVQTPMLHTVNEQEKNVDLILSDKRPREILQKLYNSTRKRTDELKSQLNQYEYIETFLQGLLTPDNGVVECHLHENGTDEINVLENFAKSTVKLNKGILLESDIDDVPSANNSDKGHIQHSQGSQDNHVLPEQKLAEPPKSDQLITQICDNRNFDKHESNDDTQQNSIQELKQKFKLLVKQKCNSMCENQVTIKSDPLPRKFSAPTKIHRTKPAVPPRNWKEKSLSKHFEHGIDFAPILSTGQPKLKSTTIVGGNSTFQGKGKIKETDLDTDVCSNNNCDIQNPVDDNNTSLSPGNSEIEIHADYCRTEADEGDNMRKVQNKSSKESGGNVVVTSFRKISQENEVITSQVDTEVKNVKNDPSDHLHVDRTLCDDLPGLPVRKVSMDINDLENETNLQKKRQSRNVYENISLDLILTRSQKTGDSDSDDGLYDNVSQFRKKDLNNGVLKSDGITSNNNLDALSISSGGDNSTSSASQSPSANPDYVPSFRDSVFINDEKKFENNGKPLDGADGGRGENELGQMTEISITKSTDDEDSPEDTVSSEKLDDVKCLDFERKQQEREKKLHMRHIVVKGILESEKTYLQILHEITLIKRKLQTKSLQEHRMCPLEDLSKIFYNVEEIKKFHHTFISNLEEKVKNWSDEQRIGEIFKELTVYLPVYKEYVANLNNAKELIQRCSNDNDEFKEIVSTMEINMSNGSIEKTSLEEALFKPVQRLQRNTLVLHDLLKHTPEDHPDYFMLSKALNLADLSIKTIGGQEESNTSSKPKEHGHLVKSGFVVEVLGHSRKLRFLFLYSDVIVCTKHKVSGRRKEKSFECKWFIHISNVNVDTKSTDDSSYSCKDDIEAMKKRIVCLKSELRREDGKNNESFKDRPWSIAGKVSSRNIEKLRKKIEEQEAQLVLSSPYLPLHIKTRDEDSKDYIILISTDFEREEWRDAILSQQRHPHGVGLTRELSIHGIQTLINKSTQLPQVNSIGNVLSKRDEEMLSGLLNVTIHSLNGLEQPCDVFVVLELDSYGHFFKKAQTHICLRTVDPTWDEDFELELEGSQTIRILCYKVACPSNILIGRSALELSKEWLSSSFKEQKISMNEKSLTISIRHTTTAKTLKRTLSKLQGGIFGFKIKTVAMREGKTIPTFVSACIREVEQKGINEVGIYRISAVTSEIQKIKKTFDKSKLLD